MFLSHILSSWPCPPFWAVPQAAPGRVAQPGLQRLHDRGHGGAPCSAPKSLTATPRSCSIRSVPQMGNQSQRREEQHNTKACFPPHPRDGSMSGRKELGVSHIWDWVLVPPTILSDAGARGVLSLGLFAHLENGHNGFWSAFLTGDLGVVRAGKGRSVSSGSGSPVSGAARPDVGQDKRAGLAFVFMGTPWTESNRRWQSSTHSFPDTESP